MRNYFLGGKPKLRFECSQETDDTVVIFILKGSHLICLIILSVFLMSLKPIVKPKICDRYVLAGPLHNLKSPSLRRPSTCAI